MDELAETIVLSGFDPAGEYPGHLGLKTMQERAVQAGGRLEISSTPGSGTALRVTMPNRQ